MFATTSLHSWSASTASGLPASPRGSIREVSTVILPASGLVAVLTYDSREGDASHLRCDIRRGRRRIGLLCRGSW
jgi:hypothetical protein